MYVSGCPNSCAQHQIGDIGLAGSKVRVGGRTSDGYQVFLGADLASHVSARSSAGWREDDLDAAVDAVVGTWEALRHPGESLGAVHRLGRDAFAAQVAAALADRWAHRSPSPTADPSPPAIR